MSQNPWGAPNNPWGAQPAAWGGPMQAPPMAAPQMMAPQMMAPQMPAPQMMMAPGVQPGGYPMPMYPPSATARRPGSSNGKMLLLLLLIPVALIFLIVLIKAMTSSGDNNNSYNPPPPTTTTQVQPTTSEPTTTEPTTPTPPPPPPTTPAVQYVNDDYVIGDPDMNPPELPVPANGQEAVDMLAFNAFYDQAVPVPVRCEIPNIDPSKASKAELETYLNDAVICLMRTWGPALEASGYNAPRPGVTVYTGEVQSACGKLPAQNAVYCSADQQVYYESTLPTLFPKYAHDPIVPVSVVAHEFGHTIQALTGMLYAEIGFEQGATNQGDEAAANNLSRRLEVQADCFAGAFLQAVSQSANIDAKEQGIVGEVFFSIGDDVLTGDPNYDGNHGQGATRRNWIQIGLTAPTAKSCNTWLDKVTDDQVR